MLDPDHDSRIAASQHTAQITVELIKASKKTELCYRNAILETQRKISRTKELLNVGTVRLFTSRLEFEA